MRSQDRIFIPFIDGTLDYNCRECGYACCRMGSLVLNNKAKSVLLKRHPFLKYFCYAKSSRLYTIMKYPRCWFFERGGTCYIQKKYGYSCKPIDGRLHPFYVARCRDEYVILTEGCQELYAVRRSKNVFHKQILKNAQEAARLNFISKSIYWTKKRLKLEKDILEGSKKFLDNSNYLEFSTYQLALAKGAKDTAGIKQELQQYLLLWKSFLGVEELPIDNKKVTYELTAFTSLLRVNSPQLRYMDINKIPLALLALYLYMVIFFKVRKTKAYLDTYTHILENIAIGLLQIKNDNLFLRNKSLEKKLYYLRMLRNLSNIRQGKISDRIEHASFLRNGNQSRAETRGQGA